MPWSRLVALIEPHYPKGRRGCPPTGLESMLRIYFIQHWYGLADEALEDTIFESQAMRSFAGIGLSSESVPDATKLRHFRPLLEERALTCGIFHKNNAHLEDEKLLMREGTLIDATIIAEHGEVEWRVAKKRGKIKAMPESWVKDLPLGCEKLKARGERHFRIVKNLFKHRKARCREVIKNSAQLHILFALANLVIARKHLLAAA